MAWTRDDAMRKAAALLRLAARGGTPAEAAAAAAKAQAVMDEYELTRDGVEQHGQAPVDEDFAVFGSRPDGQLDAEKRQRTWRWILSSGLAKLHGCYAYNTTRTLRGELYRTTELVGRPSQVETVRYLFGWLANEVDRLAGAQGLGMGQVWRREFSEGAAWEILTILQHQRAETVREVRAAASLPGASTALAVVERNLARLQDVEGARLTAIKELRIRERSVRRQAAYEPTARDAGAAAARTIDMTGSKATLPGAKLRQLPGR